MHLQKLEGLQEQNSIIIGDTRTGKSWNINLLLNLTCNDLKYGSGEWKTMRQALPERLEAVDVLPPEKATNVDLKRLTDDEERVIIGSGWSRRDREDIQQGLAGWCAGEPIPALNDFLLPSAHHKGKSTTPAVTTVHWGLTWHVSYTCRTLDDICNMVYKHVVNLKAVSGKLTRLTACCRTIPGIKPFVT